MDLKYLPLISGKLFLFVAQILILIASIAYIQIIYSNDILPDKVVKETYPQTNCTVVSKELSKKGHVVHRYRASFLISYAVNGTSYKNWVSGNGLDQAYFHESEPQEDTLQQFDVGGVYPCWYNPETPQLAVLVLRHDWMSTLPLLPPTLIALVCCYYILKGVLDFFGFLALKKEESKKHYKK